ncbi:MAG: VOC family protein, partial [Bdellovibrionales bacterium]|nr:VOC family protein [Bdellovibrionales bacterium]
METNTSSSNMIVNPIPENYRGPIPYLYVDNANAAIEFYIQAFGAKELVCIRDSKNKVAHCELEIGRFKLVLADEYPAADCLSPKTLGGASAGFILYFEDAERFFTRAL